MGPSCFWDPSARGFNPIGLRGGVSAGAERGNEMSDAEKAAVMRYCADQRMPSSELVSSEFQEFAAEICEDE